MEGLADREGWRTPKPWHEVLSLGEQQALGTRTHTLRHCGRHLRCLLRGFANALFVSHREITLSPAELCRAGRGDIGACG